MGLLYLRVDAWVLLAKPLFRCCLLPEASTYGTSLIRFLNGTGFVSCLHPGASPSGTKDYHYAGCGDLASLQGTMKEFFRAFLVPVVADDGELPP